MKLTRHNGRTGKNGAYNPRHNDRRFDIENSGHIDVERAKRNVYWDCYNGFSTAKMREENKEYDCPFEKVEKMYYVENYADYIMAQNERNEKTRHTERNRTVEDLLTNNKTCPEESIYQIGTVDESVSGEILAEIAAEFFAEMEERFGSHVHILDWALHLDEATPHIHERHVFDCKNRYGELCPQQEKALEELGIPLPNPDMKKGKNNNRKQTFDAECRKMLFRICEKHDIYLQTEPSYGGRGYLEKQDFIIEKQKETLHRHEEAIEEKRQEISQKQAALEDITMKLADVENLVDEVAEQAYEKACEAVADTVRQETRKEDIKIIDDYAKWLSAPERVDDKKLRDYAVRRLEALKESFLKSTRGIVEKITKSLHEPEREKENLEQVKTRARISLKAQLSAKKKEVDAYKAQHQGTNIKQAGKDKQSL